MLKMIRRNQRSRLLVLKRQHLHRWHPNPGIQNAGRIQLSVSQKRILDHLVQNSLRNDGVTAWRELILVAVRRKPGVVELEGEEIEVGDASVDPVRIRNHDFWGRGVVVRRDDDDGVGAGGVDDGLGELGPCLDEGVLLALERERTGAMSDGEDGTAKFLGRW